MRDQFFDQLGGAPVADRSPDSGKDLARGHAKDLGKHPLYQEKPQRGPRAKAWSWVVAAALTGLAVLIAVTVITLNVKLLWDFVAAP